MSDQLDLDLGICAPATVQPPAPDGRPITVTIDAWVTLCQAVHEQGKRLDLLTKATAELTRRLTGAA